MRTLLSTVIGVIIGSMIAYVLSRKELVGRKFITTYFLVTMYISAGLIPTYFLIKDLKMLNSFAVYVIPGIVNVYNIIIIKSFIQSLPESLTEAAMVDGADHFQHLRKWTTGRKYNYPYFYQGSSDYCCFRTDPCCVSIHAEVFRKRSYTGGYQGMSYISRSNFFRYSDGVQPLSSRKLRLNEERL